MSEDMIVELKEDLNHANALMEPRILVLLLHLHVEYYVLQLCNENNIPTAEPPEKPCPKCGQRRNTSTRERAEKLHEASIIKKEFLELVTLICKLRNKLLHNLRPDIATLGDWINAIDPQMEYANEAMEKAYPDLLKGISPWLKLQLYIVATIVELYRKLKEARKEPPEYDFEINLVNVRQFVFNFKKLKKGRLWTTE